MSRSKKSKKNKDAKAASRTAPLPKNKLRSHVALLLLCMAILVAVGAWLKYGMQASWRATVDADNLKHISAVQIIKDIQPLEKGSFFAIDTQKIQQTILSNPWAANVAIRKIWPNNLLITIQEQRPAARWGLHAFINQNGQLFTPSDGINNAYQLPLLSGPQQDLNKVWQHFQAYNQLLAPLQLSVSQLHESTDGCWRLQLSNNLPVILGCEEPDQRLERFVALYPHLIADHPGQPQYVDLRYQHGMAIKWQS